MLNHTALLLKKWASCSGPMSLPNPDCFTPPNGIALSTRSCALTHTVPASSALTVRRALAGGRHSVRDPSRYDAVDRGREEEALLTLVETYVSDVAREARADSIDGEVAVLEERIQQFGSQFPDEPDSILGLTSRRSE